MSESKEENDNQSSWVEILQFWKNPEAATTLLKEFYKSIQKYPELSATLGVFIVIALLVFVPLIQSWLSDVTANEARKTLAQILGGLAILTGLYIAWRRVKVTEEGQITERFTRAIDQLGAVDNNGIPKIEIRLGGIYALERIANDSKADHWTVMEVLCAYIRENSLVKENLHTEQFSARISTSLIRPDIQSALTVIGKRKRWEEETEDQNLSFVKSDLNGANLAKGNWAKSNLAFCILEQAMCQKANFRNSQLIIAKMKSAFLNGAHFEGARLIGVEGLTTGQIKTAYIDEKTILPDDIEQALWDEYEKGTLPDHIAEVMEKKKKLDE